MKMKRRKVEKHEEEEEVKQKKRKRRKIGRVSRCGHEVEKRGEWGARRGGDARGRW